MKKILLIFISILALQAKSQNVDVQADERVDSLINKKIAINKLGIKTDGYVIQIFNGRSQQAKQAAEAFAILFPDFVISTEYDTPDYKVFVGAYRTIFEANEALKIIKKNPSFSAAFVRPKQITIFD